MDFARIITKMQKAYNLSLELISAYENFIFVSLVPRVFIDTLRKNY